MKHDLGRFKGLKKLIRSSMFFRKLAFKIKDINHANHVII